MTKFQDGTIFTREIKGSQVRAIGKAIRPVFAGPVTYTNVYFIAEVNLSWFSDSVHLWLRSFLSNRTEQF